MKIAIGSDHGGFELKVVLTKFLRESKMQVKDFGTHSKEFERGVLICKTGIGMTIIANKLSGVRAAACYDIDMARSSREHNDCNVLVLAANYMDEEKAKEIVKVWLKAKHLGERHARRVEQIREFEKDLKRDRKR